MSKAGAFVGFDNATYSRVGMFKGARLARFFVCSKMCSDARLPL